MMDEDKTSIEFDLPAGQAESLRRQFYSFIAALEMQAAKHTVAGDLETFGQVTAQANTCRGYLVRIEIDGETIHYTNYKDRRPAKLIFVNRDLDPLMSDVMEQLHKQANKAPVLVDDTIPQKSTESFFDKPLEVKDVHSSSEESSG